MGTRHDLSFCACTTACLASNLLVSMGPHPHLWLWIAKRRLLVQNYKSPCVPDLTCRFVHAKRRDLHQNYYSLWVPALICGFCMQSSDFWTRNTSLYGYYISPVVLCMQNSVISTRITCLYWSQPSSVVFGCKKARIICLYGSQTSPVSFCASKTARLASELLVSTGPCPHLWFLHAQ